MMKKKRKKKYSIKMEIIMFQRNQIMKIWYKRIKEQEL